MDTGSNNAVAEIKTRKQHKETLSKKMIHLAADYNEGTRADLSGRDVCVSMLIGAAATLGIVPKRDEEKDELAELTALAILMGGPDALSRHLMSLVKTINHI